MKKSAYTTPYHGELPATMTPYEARALCFWAAVGISKSTSGSYHDAAQSEGDPGIVRTWADLLKLNLPIAPKFKL